ncbi:MAG: T9SS type A sorting domain-containing protein [Flavobacteriales bacterium]|nr:T9SS type A sorting domain-containing protein [Flavobacteriales bacterium]
MGRDDLTGRVQMVRVKWKAVRTTTTCTVVDANGCAYTMNVLVVVDPGTGVFTSATSSVALFPVPVSNAMTIQGLAPGVRYEVLDAAGRVVLRGSGNGTSTTMDATALRPGLHLLRWLDEGALYVLRFIKD